MATIRITARQLSAWMVVSADPLAVAAFLISASLLKLLAVHNRLKVRACGRADVLARVGACTCPCVHVDGQVHVTSIYMRACMRACVRACASTIAYLESAVHLHLTHDPATHTNKNTSIRAHTP